MRAGATWVPSFAHSRRAAATSRPRARLLHEGLVDVAEGEEVLPGVPEDVFRRSPSGAAMGASAVVSKPKTVAAVSPSMALASCSGTPAVPSVALK